jgi:tetratricopeptide (TPR) repeat protein
MPSTQRTRQVTLLAKQTSLLDPFKTSMETLGQKVIHIESTEEAVQMVRNEACEILVHVLQDFERNDVGFFHHRLVRSEKGSKVCRFIVYRGDNTRAMAFAADCGMLKGIQAEKAMSTMGATLEFALQAFEQLAPEVQKAHQLVASGDCAFDLETTNFIHLVAQQYPNLKSFQCASARLNLMKGEIKKAAVQTRKVLEDEPWNVRALSLLGDILLEAGNVQEAQRLLMAAEGIAAGNPFRLLSLARLYIKLEQIDAAKSSLMKSIEIRPIPESINKLMGELSLSDEEKTKISLAIDETMAKILT